MNFPLNRNDFKLYQGLNNPIQILIRDVDRAPVTFPDGIIPVVNIIHRQTQQVVFTTPLTLVDAGQSLWSFQVQASDIADWTIGWCTYTVITTDSQGNVAALFMDRGYKLEGEVEIIQGPYPPRISARQLQASAFTSQGQSLFCGALPGAAQLKNLSGLHTAVLYGTGLTGTCEVQVLLDASPSNVDSQWMTVQTETLTNLTGLHDFSFEGNYVWVRFKITVTAGTFTQILVRC